MNTWRTWDLAKHTPADGPYDKSARGACSATARWRARGRVSKDREDGEEVVVGRGKMQRGDGAWTSFYDDGKTLAEGQYADNRASGNWTLYPHSGNVAAEGAFAAAIAPAGGTSTTTRRTRRRSRSVVRGRGRVTGTWKHFDRNGELLARTWTETPNQWAIWPSDGPDDVDSGDGFMLDIVARPGEVKHVSHTGTVNQRPLALDMYAFDGERIYIHKDSDGEIMYDQNGWGTHARRRSVAGSGLRVEREAQDVRSPRRSCAAARGALRGHRIGATARTAAPLWPCRARAPTRSTCWSRRATRCVR